MKKCLIIFNLPAPNALPDELDVLEQVKFAAETLTEIGISVTEKGLTNDFYNEIVTIRSSDYDFIFNLVETAWEKAEILYFIPALLNVFKIPYSGSPVEAAFTTASKVLAKKIMRSNGIPVSNGFSPSGWAGMTIGTKYIMKPVWEDGSIGITEESVFIFDGKKPEVLADKDDEHWFVEEFIDGREFNVSVIAGPDGPEMLPPAEMCFHDYPTHLPKIVSYKAKWVEDTFQYENSSRAFPDNISGKLYSEINEVVIKCWEVFNLHGYARVDMRVDKNDNIYVLEVNANPCLSPGSGFLAACSRKGFLYTEVMTRIISDLNNK
ncbi:MAG TPA: ATP-grasp domain-containing protein [Bacteroidales bacterium]|nr:ATP-grasp domain-containing protein [Bacteroidales bacterium]HPT12004.1 ATP-grasp domain-containing protein [Bacteroidales bacterium]